MAYGMAGDATPDNNSMMGIGNAPMTSAPGSLVPHYDAALTVDDAVKNRGLHPHIGKNGVAVASGEEFVYDGPDRLDIGLVHGKTYRWGDTHGGSSTIPDVYMPDAPPEHGVSARQVARDQAFMAANNPRFSGASFPSIPPSEATYKEPAAPFAGAEYKRPATDEELSDAGLQAEVERQTARSGLYASAEGGIPSGWTPEETQAPAAPEGALPVAPVSSQQIADQAQQVQQDGSVADEDKDAATTNNILEQHSAALGPNDARVTRRINADTGSYRITGKYFVPGDPVHDEKLLADVSDEDKAKLPAISTAIARGEPFSFLHYSAPVEEGAEEGPTRSSRSYEQSLSTAEQRIAGTAAGRLQRATIIPQQFAVSEPGVDKETGQPRPHTVSLEGFYNDAALHNAVHTINAANAVGIPIPYGSINEPKFQRDLGGYIQNQQHGFRGDGQGPLIGADNQPVEAYRQEQAKAPADQYMPHLLNKDESDFLNTAINIVPPAGKKPANLPAGFGEKARWLQRVNEGYIGKEYGPNKLRETLDRMMPMETRGRGKPRPWSKHQLEQTYARFRLENIKSTMPSPMSPESIRARAGAFEPHIIPRAPKEVYTAAEHKASPVSRNPEMGAPLGINHANNGSFRPDNNGSRNVRWPLAFNGAIDAAPIAQPVERDPEIGAPIGEGKEKITHAGVRFRSGNIYLGPFHGAAYQSGLEAGEPEEPDTKGQGFFTNHGRFLTRAEYFSEAAKRRAAAPPAPIGRNPEVGAPVGEGQDPLETLGGSVKEARDRGVWNFRKRETKGSQYGDSKRHVYDIEPIDVPAHWKHGQVPYPFKTKYSYDPEHAEVNEEGRAQFKDPSKRWITEEPDPNLLYRGMSHEEYENGRRNGHFESTGDYNLGEEQKGLTYFSPTPGTAQSYAHGFAPWQYHATPSRPAHVVAIKRPAANRLYINPRYEDEVGVRGKIPLKDIHHVWTGYPAIINPGEMDVIDDWHGIREGSRSAPDAQLRWEKEAAPKPIGANPEMGAPLGEGQDLHERGISAQGQAEFQSVGPHEFIRQRNLSKRPQYLSKLSPEDITNHKLWMNQSGTAGAAVSPEGDIQNVFNNGGGRGAGQRALVHAIRNGGRTLDAYDPYLPSLYHQFGFHETGRMKFNRAFAPPNWDYQEADEPDVVFMAHRGYHPGGEARALQRGLNEKEWLKHEPSPNRETDWDKAKDRSRRAVPGLVGETSRPETERTGEESGNPSGPGDGQPLAGNPEVGAPLGEGQENENEGTPGLAEEGSGQRGKGKSAAGSHARRLAAYIEALSGPEAESTENLDRDYFLRSQEIKRQEKILLQLAKDRGELHAPVAEPAHAGGGEHDVWFDPDGKRVTKEVSSYGSEGYGFAPNMERSQLEAPPRRVKLRHATPLEYLQRLQLAKEHFGDDTRFLGVSQTPHSIRLRTSQKRIHESEPPSWDEMTDSMMDEHGFEPHPTIDDLWQHPGTGTLASDVLPRNFVKNEQGKPVPVDIVLHHGAPVSSNPEMGAPLGEGQEEPESQGDIGEAANVTQPMPTPEQVQGFNPRLAGGQYPANVQPEQRVTLPPAPIAAPVARQPADIRKRIGERPTDPFQAKMYDRVAKRLSTELPHPAIPLRPARKPNGDFKVAGEKGKEAPLYEKEDYALHSAPMLGKKALGFDEEGTMNKAPKGTVDKLAKGDLNYLNPTDRLRVSHLNEISAVDAYADKLGQMFESARGIPKIMLAKDWYNDTEGLVKKLFGKDADMVINLLAATSARNGVQPNYKIAMQAYHQYLRGDFDEAIKLYNKAHDLKEKGLLAQHVKDLGLSKTLLSDHKAMAAYIKHHGIMPRQSAEGNKGKLFSMHSLPVLKVLSHHWLEEVKGPKTPTYSGNMTGKTLQATIDMWAARTMHRLGFEGYTGKKPWLMQPASEPGVNNVDFGLSQLAFRKAAEKYGLEPRQMQAILWFAEQQHWQKNKWEQEKDPAKRDYRPMLREYVRPAWAQRPTAMPMAAPVA